MYPRVMREVADEVAKPLNDIHHIMKGQFDDVLIDLKRGNITPIFKKGKKTRRPREPQADQSHLSAQDHEVGPPRNYAKAHRKQGNG